MQLSETYEELLDELRIGLQTQNKISYKRNTHNYYECFLGNITFYLAAVFRVVVVFFFTFLAQTTFTFEVVFDGVLRVFLIAFIGTVSDHISFCFSKALCLRLFCIALQ